MATDASLMQLAEALLELVIVNWAEKIDVHGGGMG